MASRRALYLSHNGMTEPLGRSQVLPYVRGLARAGWEMEIVAFEPANSDLATIETLRRELAASGVAYQAARRSPSHAPAVKAWEAAQAFVRLARRALLSRPSILHARSYLPGAVAQTLAAMSPGTRFIFDCRGLMADEYADGGYWSRSSLRYRLVKRVERIMFHRAGAVVTLTKRLRAWLHDHAWVRPRATVEVIPCCVDLDEFRATDDERQRARAALGAGDRFVLAYSGNLGSWYREDEMARLFAALRRRRPSLFAVFTRASADRLRAALRREGVADDDVVVRALAPNEMARWLAGADAGLSFAEPWFSKIASSPVKVAEYLALGIPVVMNRGIGDGDALLVEKGPIIDAGELTVEDIERTSLTLAGLSVDPMLRARARALAAREFDLEQVGIARYRDLYERVAA